MSISSSSAWGAETQFFYSLTPEVVLEAVEAFGYRATGRSLALNSMENRVYEVEIEHDDEDLSPRDPKRYRIIKFYRPGRWTKEQILEEHQFLLELTRTEIPVIAPEQDASGETLKQISGLWCVLFPKMGGRCPEELQPEQLERVGRLLARIHIAGKSKVAHHRVHLSPQTYGFESLRFLEESGLVAPSERAAYFATARAICDKLAPQFAKLKTQRIHGDCHLGNLLWNNNGPFFVDFDDMVVGPPIQDLWLLFPSVGEDALDRWNMILEGYETMLPFDRSSLRFVEGLRALRFMHFAAWIGKRWSDPAFPLAFPNYGTERYWQESTMDLRTQLAAVEIAMAD